MTSLTEPIPGSATLAVGQWKACPKDTLDTEQCNKAWLKYNTKHQYDHLANSQQSGDESLEALDEGGDEHVQDASASPEHVLRHEHESNKTTLQEETHEHVVKRDDEATQCLGKPTPRKRQTPESHPETPVEETQKKSSKNEMESRSTEKETTMTQSDKAQEKFNKRISEAKEFLERKLQELKKSAKKASMIEDRTSTTNQLLKLLNQEKPSVLVVDMVKYFKEQSELKGDNADLTTAMKKKMNEALESK